MGQSGSRKPGEVSTQGSGSETVAAQSSAQSSTKASTPTAAPIPARPGQVVSVQDVINKKGHIAVTGRYVCDRPLSEFYKVETKVVGSGMSGQVHLATCILDGKKKAVKSFKKKGLPMRKRIELKSEVEIYLALDHPHVARLDRVFETDSDVFLVMEYMSGGELYDRLSSKKQYTEEAAANTTHQMLLAICYLHSHNIAHRDLKLENFLYEAKDTEHLKLIDFGFAKFREHDTKMSQACGSVHYVAPEVLAHSYTNQADMWSLGVIVYMLLTGSPPFHGTDEEVLKKIKAGSPHWSKRFLRLSEEAKKFVKELLVVDPVARLSAEAALQHAWMKMKHTLNEAVLDIDIVSSLRNYAHASSFRRAVLSMMAWSLSTEERIELRDLFLAIDTAGKGTITHSELKSILEENFHISSMEAEELFKTLDTDNDNEIAYTEFLAAALQGRVKVHEDLLRKTFQRFDADSSQKLSIDNLRSVLGTHFEGQEVDQLLAEADINHDGEIDYEEFIAYFHKSQGTEEDAAEGQTRERAATTESMPTKKNLHTEKLGAFVDSLVQEDGAARTEAEAAAAPVTPKPLNRRGDQAMQIGGM